MYLGFAIGPQAYLHQWTKIATKYEDRCQSLREANAGTLTTVMLYNQRCHTLWTYVGQLAPPTAEILSAEMEWHSKLLHGPRCFFAPDTAVRMKELGVPKQFASLRVTMLASKVRTAMSTARGHWQRWRQELAAAREEHLCAMWEIMGKWGPPHWDSPSFADVLYGAMNGEFFHDTKGRDQAKAVIRSFEERVSEGPLQAAVAEQLLPVMHPKLPWESLVSRLHRWCPDASRIFGDDSISEMTMQITADTLRSAPASVKVSWLRLLANGWPTTVRFHEKRLEPCFACGTANMDRVDHFMGCDMLWETLRAVTGVEIPTCIIGRLGVDGPDEMRTVVVGALGAVYDAYTHIRFSCSMRGFVLYDILSGKWQRILIRWPNLQRAALRLRIDHREGVAH